jgi:hypothetical protein
MRGSRSICVLVTAVVALFAADGIRWNRLKFEGPTLTLSQVQLSEGERAALKAALSAEIGPPSPNVSAEDQAADFRIKLLDLNGDRIPEVIAQANGRFWCGASGNCPFLVFRKAGSAYESMLADMDEYQGFTVTKQRTSGYLDLILSRHESANQQDLVVFKYRDGKYRASGCYEATWNNADEDRAPKEPAISKCQ